MLPMIPILSSNYCQTKKPHPWRSFSLSLTVCTGNGNYLCPYRGYFSIY
ncbi:hypothetical protein [Coxiella-like endosymbiont of Rhipicephalus sanguineus]